MNGTEKPRLAAPANTIDCHMHLYDAATPVAKTAVVPPPVWASVDAYRKVQARLGISRAVVVQPSAYGLNNSVTLNGVEALGRDKARAVVVVNDATPDAEWRRLSAIGACGLRMHMLPGGAVGWEDMASLARKAADHGWHMQIQMDGRYLHERVDFLKTLPCTLVVDHVGKFLEPVTVDHPGFKALASLLETGRVWLKLSAAYEVSRAGPPDFRDTGALATEAARLAPERMVWASNWPHVSKLADPPDDAGQLDTLLYWIADPALRARILIDNPAKLYGFTA
ncbi:MAG: amidohydrolase [Tagaea sp. CACIAM 22H2]|nr:amidohydrolase [Tagaea sp. CACIAM 22H2]